MAYLVKVEATPKSTTKLLTRLRDLRIDPSIKIRDDFHLTLLFAKEWINPPEIKTYDPPLEYKIYGVAQFGNTVVLLLDCPDETAVIRKRNSELIQKMGAIPEYPTYNPHVTIFYSETPYPKMEEIELIFNGMTICFSQEKAKIFN